ncbi:MAG: crotonase/enoyl-CoA hydratase family protein [Myxococcota bacterium]
MNDRVRIHIDQGIATVTLSRPDKHNALDEAMIDGLLAAAKSIGRDSSIRSVILRGEGPSFCSGLDFASAKRNPLFLAKIFVNAPLSRMNRVQRVSLAWRDLPVPVIAVVHGKCFGGGLQIALGADFRLCTADAEFSIMEICYGLVPDMGGTVVFREQIRLDHLKELTMTGERVGAERAQAVGLVTRIEDDPEAAALELARKVARRSPDAIAMTKRLLNDISHGSLRTLLRRERWAQMRLFGRPNQKTAAKSQSLDEVTYRPRRIG